MTEQTALNGKYRAYPEYKDSGVEWLGEVPEHWELTRVKYVAEITPKKPSVRREQSCSFIPMEKLKTDVIELSETRKINDVYDGYTYFANGDILMAKVTPCFENKNIAIAEGLVNQIGFGSSEIYPIRVNERTSNRFLFYRLQEDGFMELAIGAMTGAGGLRRVPSETLANYCCAVPAFEEQQKIADFLDHETAKIDTLIDKQQQLIQLLKEKRQAVISHAVTRGLNPNAPMRDSGVEWLGEVPEHWETGSLRWFIDIASGEGLSNTKIESLKDEHFEFRVVGGNGTMGFTKKVNTTEQAFAVGRVGALCGNIHFIDEPCWITDNALKISTWANFNNEYLYYLLTAARLNDYASRSAQPLITGEQVKALKCLIPPVHEQVEVGQHIQAELGKFEKLISKNELAMSLAKEYRTALISAAVTGKIDVRHFI